MRTVMLKCTSVIINKPKRFSEFVTRCGKKLFILQHITSAAKYKTFKKSNICVLNTLIAPDYRTAGMVNCIVVSVGWVTFIPFGSMIQPLNS